ncbi:MAG: hypothetical protein ACK5Q5_02370 [Planctomycetaceae bacterium]
MLRTPLKLLGLLAAISFAGPTPSAEACWLFGGGGRWGAFRPVSWGSYYGGYSGYNYGGYGWNNCGSCGGCSSGGCSRGGCGYGGCNSGACGGVSSYYGPVPDTCGGCGDSTCGGTCGSSFSNCCTQYSPSTTEPVPERSDTSPGSDNFRSQPGNPNRSNPNPVNPNPINPNPATPPSSIPFPNPTDINSNPSTNWNSGGDYNLNRDSTDYLKERGGDAPGFVPPRTSPNPAEPMFDPGLEGSKSIDTEIEPLKIDSPVAVAFRAQRLRVRVTSSQTAPHIAAKPLPSVNDGWEPVRNAASVASR